jgi:hypothetical protein
MQRFFLHISHFSFTAEGSDSEVDAELGDAERVFTACAEKALMRFADSRGVETTFYVPRGRGIWL